MSSPSEGTPTTTGPEARSGAATMLRWGVGILAAAAVVGSAVHLTTEVSGWLADPTFLQDPLAAANRVIRLAANPAFAVLAMLIVLFTAAEAGPLYGALFLSAYSLWGLALGSWSGENGLWLAVYVTATDWTSHGAAIRFAQVFPRPLVAADVTPTSAGPIRLTLARGSGALLRPIVFWPAFLGMELLVRLSTGFAVYLTHVVVVSALALRYFYASYKTGTEEARQKVFWLMEAAVVFLTFELIQHTLRAFNALGIFELDLPFWFSWTHVGQTWLALICFALAIFHKGAFDSRLVLRRTTVASVSGTVAVVVFITLETAVGEVLTAFVGAETQVGTIIAGVVAALVLRPISDRIDRRFGAGKRDLPT